MAQIAPDVLASVERFLAVIGRRLRIDAAYLYGSQASGSAHPWSDIDVAVVSPDFSDDLFQERVTLMLWAAEIDDRIEPCPFTPDRFEPNDPLASEISHHGVRLVQPARTGRTRAIRRSPSCCCPNPCAARTRIGRP